MRNQNSIFRFLRPRAQAEFTDRETPLKIFTTAIERVTTTPTTTRPYCEILQFYGIGGIGKTRLLEQYQLILNESRLEFVRANVDFDDSSVREPHRALLRIRHTAEGKKRITFKVFDFAYAVYFAKRNPDFSLNNDNQELLERIGLIGNIISIFDGFGLMGAAKEIIEQAKKYADKLSIKGQAREALNALSNMSERDIADALPDFLAYDLNRHAESGIPTVLFIDTYEALWENHTDERDQFQRDAWLRRLCSGLEKALVVIVGREKLRWPDHDSIWSARVSTHRLAQLSKKDVRRFLLSAKLSNETLIEKITTVAEGHPFYLDLCLDTIAQEGEAEPNEWPESQRELFERFAKNLSSDELALLKRLAPLNTYDLTYARAVARHFNISLNDDKIRAHTRFSFVKQHQHGATIHNLMRLSLLENMVGDSAEEVRRFALKHFTERLRSAQSSSPDAEIILPFQECARQLKHLDAHEEVTNWLDDVGRNAISLLQHRAATEPILLSLEALEGILPPENWPEDVQTAYADITHLVGRYEKSVAMLECLIERAGPVSEWTQEIAFANIRRMHHSMMYRPVHKVWNEAERAIHRLDPSIYGKAYDEAAFLLGGNLGCARGVPADAWPWLIEALRRSYRRGDDTLRARIYRKAADLYRIAGATKRSRQVLMRAFDLAKAINVPRYVNYLNCTHIDQLRLERRYDEALALVEPTREKIASHNLDGWIGHTYIAECALYLDTGRTGAACWTLEKAIISYDRTNHLWGKLQVRILQERARAQTQSGYDTQGVDVNDLLSRLIEAGYVRDAKGLSEFAAGKTQRIPAIAYL